ncbi:Aste57867_28 [Aphanomyces stellatus]|uniref:Aste57867_28 protein n=1 Tax=Aphanomyces stellatus TaxID=120398 RepID=A0A485K200_9STRA|nr:hypothetical protein As57867_000028 [Aphanomyces stellatus]VFT77254.1 Aste57867_28 [Aphanomyces stellatus]
MPTASVAAVLHSEELFLTVCAYQSGVPGSIQDVVNCPTINGIYGRIVVRQSPTVDGTKKYIDVLMADLPAIMEHRRQVVTSVLANPRAAADLHLLLSTHAHLRDVVAEYAAFFGDMELMALICENAKERLPWFIYTIARQQIYRMASTLFHLAAFHGHVGIMQVLDKTYPPFWRSGSIMTYSDLEVAAERSQLPSVRYAIKTAKKVGSNEYWGLRNYLRRNRKWAAVSTWCQHLYLVDVLAGEGNHDLVTLLLGHQAEYTEAAIDNAASNGHLAMVEYFHIKAESKCTTKAMDGAAANGHLEVVQFLHDHRTEGCTSDAMDEAAAHGHDSIVRFLAAKRNECGSVKAMNTYVTRGDLAMVKVIAINKCSSGNVNLAASLGHLEIVQYLVGDMGVDFATPAIEAAVKRDHVNVLEYLLSRRPEMCIAKFMQMAHAAKMTVVVEYLDGHRCECCKRIPRDELLAAKPPTKRRRKN